MDIWRDLGLLGPLERCAAIGTEQASTPIGICRDRVRSRGNYRGHPAYATGAVQPWLMKLETHEGVVADPATVDVLSRVVAGLTKVGEAYVILNDDKGDETYVQAAGTVGEKFIIEYRVGRMGDHFRGDRRVSADELATMLTGYLHRTSDWSCSLTWHRVRVDQAPPSA